MDAPNRQCFFVYPIKSTSDNFWILPDCAELRLFVVGFATITPLMKTRPQPFHLLPYWHLAPFAVHLAIIVQSECPI